MIFLIFLNFFYVKANEQYEKNLDLVTRNMSSSCNVFQTFSRPFPRAFFSTQKMKTWDFIKPLDLKKRFAQAIVIDVRSSREFQKSHIKSAVNIPIDVFKSSKSLEDIEKAFYSQGLLDPLSPKKLVVFHCRVSLIRGPDALQSLCQKLNQTRGLKNASVWDSLGTFNY